LIASSGEGNREGLAAAKKQIKQRYKDTTMFIKSVFIKQRRVLVASTFFEIRTI